MNNEPEVRSRRFGTYLRKLRERKRLSLDAVEELSAGFSERVSKSHLSRIETGHSVPTFTRLFTLSRIYGVPVASLAERFEIDLRREEIPAEVEGKSDEEVLEEATRLRIAGRYMEALALCEALLERLPEASHGEAVAPEVVRVRLHRVECLVHLSRNVLAKDECEEILSLQALGADQRLLALEYFVISCVNLGRLTVAMMGLERAEVDLSNPDAPGRLGADLAAIRGKVLILTNQPEQAVKTYARAVEMYDRIQEPFESCRARVNLAYALLEAGRHGRAREELARALSTSESSGFDRQKAIALGHFAVLEFRDGNLDAAESYALRSNAIARPREFLSVVFRNCYYLWKVARTRGDDAGVKANERTLRAYVSRVEEHMTEAQGFRAFLAGEGA